jgi:hypothetical protein
LKLGLCSAVVTKLQAMGPVQAECQTLFVWREACGPKLAVDFIDGNDEYLIAWSLIN